VQPWPGEVLEERAGEIAVGFAALLTRQAAWRHRRVETISVLSHERVRRHVSVDFTVPAAHREEIRLGECEWVVPLAYLAKRLLVNFDLGVEDEAAIPLLRSDEAQLISRELLYLMLEMDTEAAVEEDVAPLIEWRSRSSRARWGRCRGSRRWPHSSRAGSCCARCSTTSRGGGW
jgi:hypothetical protein